jgi:hypothetical protein
VRLGRRWGRWGYYGGGAAGSYVYVRSGGGFTPGGGGGELSVANALVNDFFGGQQLEAGKECPVACEETIGGHRTVAELVDPRRRN